MTFKLVSANLPDRVAKTVTSCLNIELIDFYESRTCTTILKQEIEKEGRRRQMLYFLTEMEQDRLIKEVFGGTPPLSKA